MRKTWILLAAALIATALLAWSRVGALNLPRVRGGISPESSGLAGLETMKRLDDFLWSNTNWSKSSGVSSGNWPAEARRVHEGIVAVDRGEHSAGLELIRDGVRADPASLVLGNAYRMILFHLRREFLMAQRAHGVLVPHFSPHLDRQPIAFFEELCRANDTREIKLQLALAWVDEMLLFPALEMKAPASVEAVEILSEVIDGDSSYVPALFGRGLNYLHRPARLVWPAADASPTDAAVQDIGRCIRIGRTLGVGSKRLQATLAIALGDAYVKAGRLGVARSWWQIAQNLCHDDDVQAAIRRRYGWHDEEILDRLEEELDRARSQLDQPMTDLAIIWN